MQYVVETAEEMRAIGSALGRTAQPGDVLWLHGELGAGKTEMTKGIAGGLEARDHVSSPSFALIHEYRAGRLLLFHIDLYRLDTDAAQDLGLEDYLEGDGVTVIEWGERLPHTYFLDGLDIDISFLDSDDARRLIFRPRGCAGVAWFARAQVNITWLPE